MICVLGALADGSMSIFTAEDAAREAATEIERGNWCVGCRSIEVGLGPGVSSLKGSADGQSRAQSKRLHSRANLA